MRLQEIAVEQLMRGPARGRWPARSSGAGQDIEAMGEEEITEGAVRLAVADAAAERSDGPVRGKRPVGRPGRRRIGDGGRGRRGGQRRRPRRRGRIAAGAEEVGKGEAAATAGEALHARRSVTTGERPKLRLQIQRLPQQNAPFQCA